MPKTVSNVLVFLCTTQRLAYVCVIAQHNVQHMYNMFQCTTQFNTFYLYMLIVLSCIPCIWYIRFICISLFYWTCMRFIGIHLSFLNTCKTQYVLFVYAFFFTCIRFICICHFLFIQLHTMCCVCIDMFFCKFLVYAFNLFAMSGLVLLFY